MNQRFEIFKAWSTADERIINDEWRDSLKYIVYVSPNLQIREVFTGKEVDNVYNPAVLADKEKFGLYTINYFRGRRQFMLYNKGKFTVIKDDDYPVVIKKLLEYFKKHKKLDDRLLPLSIQEITKIYLDNCRSYDQFGPWRHWWGGEEADSLGKIYNQYLQYE